ncbi:MAG: hypothetical protein ACRDNW_22920, partial [Trebonia sp.]
PNSLRNVLSRDLASLLGDAAIVAFLEQAVTNPVGTANVTAAPPDVTYDAASDMLSTLLHL